MTVLLLETKATGNNRDEMAACYVSKGRPLQCVRRIPICSWMSQKERTCIFARLNLLTLNHLLTVYLQQQNIPLFLKCRDRMCFFFYLPSRQLLVSVNVSLQRLA